MKYTLSINDKNIVLTAKNFEIVISDKLIKRSSYTTILLAKELSLELVDITSNKTNKATRFLHIESENINLGIEIEKYIQDSNYELTVSTKEIITLIETLNYNFAPNKPASKAKVAHRWSKLISEIEFYVDEFDAKATIIWQKRNEMLVKKGAILKKEIPLNKDGSIGFGVKMAQKIRDDHKASIDNYVLKEDLILKSVNEVGLFLYFAGTNSWLVLKDSNNKTIDEWTRID